MKFVNCKFDTKMRNFKKLSMDFPVIFSSAATAIFKKPVLRIPLIKASQQQEQWKLQFHSPSSPLTFPWTITESWKQKEYEVWAFRI